MSQKIKTALISVSDKSELSNILKNLKKYKIKIISSGGTFKSIKKLGYKCIEISKYTDFKEMLNGRVKTLHPKIHSGILFNRSNKVHKTEMKKQKFLSIDLVIVNFYPFEEAISKSKNLRNIVENIDIGGPTLVRAAAKNFNDVTVITEKKDYFKLIAEMKKHNGGTSLNFRELMSCKAFGLTAYYDSIISNWFNQKLDIKFPDKKTIFGKKLEDLRYGENPHQKSSIYINNLKNQNLGLNKMNGKELSYNNYNDIFASLDILFSAKKIPTTVIIKHANPCGVSSNKSPLVSFKQAFKSDPVSAFGGIIACNYKINKFIANEINKTFFEVILAKKLDKKALKILKKRKNLRIIDISKFTKKNVISAKFFDGSFLLQESDKLIFNKKKLKFVTKNKPTKKEIQEIEFAFNVCKFVKSNAIVLTSNFSTIGIGAGQANRLDSCKIATQKAKMFQPEKLNNSIAASDAFFPFADGIKTLINSGVKIIVQPGGSIRDKEVIDAANKAKIKMVLTGVRHFNH
ncbi:MAG: bifunctional phosphoribosylaminoimidazolecarboxamide formyltransferase/IMP cyclohydrolase [Pelagibacteraceae bacterium TMED287]|nr:MAG: bifunctional phosphoribosylaminoimidazolecarboxamide formyltransferase/IMP cyclohydrolase [Pelagibacteraceae bacterium TMED287]|tara:strand:+ start:3276 stop:4826 length:1551 start_codon:yes stop_codon:yes gene_type:complete